MDRPVIESVAAIHAAIVVPAENASEARHHPSPVDPLANIRGALRTLMTHTEHTPHLLHRSNDKTPRAR